MDKETRIKKELDRVSKLFADIPANQRVLTAALLQNSAFMKVTLEDLQSTINSEGVTDTYQNGAAQHGIKPSATLQAYNSLIKNYATVTKTLLELLPKQAQAEAGQALMMFATSKKSK